MSQAWILYSRGEYLDSARILRSVITRKANCEGGYYLLLCCLSELGRYPEVAALAEEALAASNNDYNVYIPILDSLAALGETERRKAILLRAVEAKNLHLRDAPEDARARSLLACNYAQLGRAEDSMREAGMACALRPNDPRILFNIACAYCNLKRKPEALEAIKGAWRAGFQNAGILRSDPDLTFLHGDPEFESLFPKSPARTMTSTDQGPGMPG